MARHLLHKQGDWSRGPVPSQRVGRRMVRVLHRDMRWRGNRVIDEVIQLVVGELDRVG
jgi:hypothetical protein